MDIFLCVENTKREVASFQSPISSSSTTTSTSHSPFQKCVDATKDENAETQETANQSEIKETKSAKKPRLVPSLKKAKQRTPKATFVTGADSESQPQDKEESIDVQVEVKKAKPAKKPRLVIPLQKVKQTIPEASFITHAEGEHRTDDEEEGVLDEQPQVKKTKSPKKPRLVKPKSDTISSISQNNGKLRINTKENNTEAGSKVIKEQAISKKELEEQLIEGKTCEEQMITQQAIKEHMISEQAMPIEEQKIKEQAEIKPSNVADNQAQWDDISVNNESAQEIVSKKGCKTIKTCSIGGSTSKTKTTPTAPATVHVPTPMPKLVKPAFRPPSLDKKAPKKMPKLSKLQFVQPSLVKSSAKDNVTVGKGSSSCAVKKTLSGSSMESSDSSQERRAPKKLEDSVIAYSDTGLAGKKLMRNMHPNASWVGTRGLGNFQRMLFMIFEPRGRFQF